MLKSLFRIAVCIFCIVMALAYLPVDWKVSVCLLAVILINANGLISRLIKWVLPWKAQVLLTIILLLAAVSIAPRSGQYIEETQEESTGTDYSNK